ncbi:putative phosphatidylinositol 4-kinase gamma 4 isoform X1 [Sesbania bispinosa]|nr:putative phosphatidylinositol 4-kinase gamma 4 isoform X1 [Sesbania bispinosa]
MSSAGVTTLSPVPREPLLSPIGFHTPLHLALDHEFISYISPIRASTEQFSTQGLWGYRRKCFAFGNQTVRSSDHQCENFLWEGIYISGGKMQGCGYVKQQIAKKEKQFADPEQQEVVCNGERLDDQRLIDDIWQANIMMQLKKGTRVGQGAFREVAAYILDHPMIGRRSLFGDEKGFAGVPPTVMAKCLHEGFNHPGDLTAKIGSLQMFMENDGSCEDMGPGAFPVKEFEDCTFEWLYWPQARQSYSQEIIDYIKSLDAEEDIALLKFHGWDLPVECARTLRISTMLLKKGVEERDDPLCHWKPDV